MANREYRRKRDFHKTPEPKGRKAHSGGRPIFVIQKHDARTLHYDFRLEVNGVLKSWAVPKGPSTNPSEKRLAVQTEDHPLEYAGFEGVIPKGSYGAGGVLIWDTGPYENVTEKDGKLEPIEKALEAGHICVCLSGEKISGAFVLQRVTKGHKQRWLLIKMDDDDADARRNPTSTEPDSVASGHSMDDIVGDAADKD